MDRERERIAGIILCSIGLWFYLQSSINFGFFHPTQNDFKHLYVAGYLADRGGNFFDDEKVLSTYTFLDYKDRITGGINPFVYPPFFAWILIPLSQIPYHTAWFLFTCLSQTAYIASLALLVRVLFRDENSQLFWWGVLMALSGCFYPLFKTYSAGQMNAFMLLVLCLAIYFLQRNRDEEAGAILGLGAAIKIAPAFMIIYLAWKGRWRGVISGSIVIVLSVVISYSFLGMDVHRAFLETTADMSYGNSTWPQHDFHFHVDPYNQAPSALWYRLFTQSQTQHGPIAIGITQQPALAKGLSYLTALLVLGGLVWMTRRNDKKLDLTEFSLWTLGMLLLPSLLWDHYLTQAILAIAVSLHLAWQGRRRALWALGFGIAAMACTFQHDHEWYKNGFMTLIMSIKLYGLLLLFLFLAVNRNEESRDGIEGTWD